MYMCIYVHVIYVQLYVPLYMCLYVPLYMYMCIYVHILVTHLLHTCTCGVCPTLKQQSAHMFASSLGCYFSDMCWWYQCWTKHPQSACCVWKQQHHPKPWCPLQARSSQGPSPLFKIAILMTDRLRLRPRLRLRLPLPLSLSLCLSLYLFLSLSLSIKSLTITISISLSLSLSISTPLRACT